MKYISKFTKFMPGAILIAGLVFFIQPRVTKAADPQSEPLLQSNNLTYLGAFRVPHSGVPGSTSNGSFDYARTGFTFYPAHNSLFMNGHVYDQKTAEISIPQPVLGGSLNALNTASVLQGLNDITEGHFENIGSGGSSCCDNGDRMGGLMVWGSKLIGSTYAYYPGDQDAVLTHFTHSLTLSQTGTFKGYYQVGTSLGASFFDGYMAPVPAEWQGLLGKALTGNCCLSIIGRTSYGPSVSSFDPDDLGVKNPVPATPLVYYDSNHQNLHAYNDQSASPYWSASDLVTGVIFPQGSGSVLFIGKHGNGPHCYGEGSSCGDPADDSKGEHNYPYYRYVWAYSANDLLAVKNGQKNPWDIKPYATWNLNLPFDSSDSVNEVQGASYDPATQRIYVSAARTDGAYPLVYILQINNLGSTPPAPTVSISASPASITSGSSSTLTWTSTNATSCTASNAWSGTKATSGSQSVSPASTSTYTLTCTGSGGSGNASTSVTVNAAVNNKPTGSLDGVKSDGTVYGWAEDPDNTAASASVDIYIDKNAGTTGASPVARVTASDNRADIGNHAFNYVLPALYQDGKAHQVWAWGIDLTDPTGNNTQLPGSPQSFTLGSSGTTVSGTACNVAALPITGTRIVNVSTESQLQTAVSNLRNGDTIVLANGTYNLTNTLFIDGKSDITIRGNSGCDGVVLAGKGMDNSNFGNVKFGIWSNSPNTTIAHLTIKNTWDNAIALNGGAQSPHIYSVKLVDIGSQFIKSNPIDIPSGTGNDNGTLEYSWMEYTVTPPTNAAHDGGAGYFNGISAHASDNWVIRGNMFKNLHDPDGTDYNWNPAVLMWDHSTNTITENNIFINVDRAIAYGLEDQATGTDHSGGVIENNFIYEQPGLFSTARKADSDGLIIAWDSPGTKVYQNTVLSNSNVNHAIEFRFSSTKGGEIKNNLTDANINLRDSATATQSGNLLTAKSTMFVNPSAGDLHLLSSATTAIDKAPTLAAVTSDIDGQVRPVGSAYDIGADEYSSGTGTPPAPTVSISASPASITSGSSSTLTWTSTNATSCTASNAWSGTKATSGSQSVSPASTSTYTLTCTGSGGSGNASISVTVNAVVNQLPQGSFDEIRTSDGVVRGWTVDLDSSTSANDVQIFFNGPVGTGTRVFSGPTSILRADVNSSLGISGNHGFEFTIPTSYRDGKSHSVYVYGIDINDSTKSTLLTGSPKSFTLSASIAVVGDINQDHIVNSIDYSILNTHWFTADSASDLNHDGIVNAIDYSILNSNWFKTW